MHYRDGTEVKLGDRIRHQPQGQPPGREGLVVALYPGATTCNLSMAVPMLKWPYTAGGTRFCGLVSIEYMTVTASECDRVEPGPNLD